MLDRGAAFLDAQRHQHLTRTVVYRRGTDEKQVQATIGKTEFEQADDSGLIYRVESGDFSCGRETQTNTARASARAVWVMVWMLNVVRASDQRRRRAARRPPRPRRAAAEGEGMAVTTRI